jgi:cytochrome c553
MRVLFICLLCVLSFSCKEEKKEQPKEKKELVMVKPSEMATLMNEMYAFNESIKQQVIEGKLNNSYPEKFNSIHSAVMTDPNDRDETFEAFSKLFLESEQALFEAPEEELVMRYNNAINACIACHTKKCSGPIPRIKKLLIK